MKCFKDSQGISSFGLHYFCYVSSIVKDYMPWLFRCTDTVTSCEQTPTHNHVVKEIAEESEQSDYQQRSDASVHWVL